MSIAEDPEKTREIDMQAEKIRALVKARGPACPETKRRAAALLSATLASGVAAPQAAPLPPPPIPAPITRAAKLGVLLLAGLVALALVGCVPVEAIQQADHEAAIGHGHAMDKSLPIEARMIGARSFRAWSAQRQALTGEDVPGASAWGLIPPELLPPIEAPR